MWEYLDGEMPRRRARHIHGHLTGCRNCSTQFAFERAFLRAVRATVRADSPSDELRTRVVAALERAGFQTSARQGAVVRRTGTFVVTCAFPADADRNSTQEIE